MYWLYTLVSEKEIEAILKEPDEAIKIHKLPNEDCNQYNN